MLNPNHRHAAAAAVAKRPGINASPPRDFLSQLRRILLSPTGIRSCVSVGTVAFVAVIVFILVVVIFHPAEQPNKSPAAKLSADIDVADLTTNSNSHVNSSNEIGGALDRKFAKDEQQKGVEKPETGASPADSNHGAQRGSANERSSNRDTRLKRMLKRPRGFKVKSRESKHGKTQELSERSKLDVNMKDEDSNSKGDGGDGQMKMAKSESDETPQFVTQQREPPIDMTQSAEWVQQQPQPTNGVTPTASASLYGGSGDAPAASRYGGMVDRELGAELQAQFHAAFYVPEESQCGNFASGLICPMNMGCGFACQLQQAATCFQVALATNRLPKLDMSKRSWGYRKRGCSGSDCGWTGFFQKLSDADQCNNALEWDTITSQERHMWRDWAPKWVEARVGVEHEHARLWFFGELHRFFLAPGYHLDNLLHNARRSFNDVKERAADSLSQSKVNTLGLHVRRTDHKVEEAVYLLDSYMPLIKNFSDLDVIYLATDDQAVIDSAKKYPEYVWHSSKLASGKVSGVGTRYSPDDLTSVVTDIYLLSECDYFVGHHSSHVSLASFMLFASRFNQPSLRALSIDRKDYEPRFPWWMDPGA